ncbi:uncharacterized protein C8A04DRAFT_28481 [Dichotomopilus funicola]|uniref:Riboflavin kinase n=1 Tax=Dichotomopilus funicola TaxID=1934379 RepID=A0AAN6V4G2_9PEZI|nr:hypothetical protein C8A04DRAFT_28481 [Dichotomopilus funicola]
MNTPTQPQIRRKPIGASPVPQTASVSSSFDTEEAPPPLPARPQLGHRLRTDVQPPIRPGSRGAEPLLQVPVARGLRLQKSMPELSRVALEPPPSPLDAEPATHATTFGPSVSPETNNVSKKTFMQNALAEAKHFAGGLIPHPTESTKHYTILRHSPALIFYRGPSTSVEVTIFSSPDKPLPGDRTFWLQQRGFSGDKGMKIKAFFNATDSWLHVTPSTQVEAHQLAADTDRAWQRDIGKASKKLVKERGLKKGHVPRETHVIRVPEASDDGYFRLILCTGKGTPNEDNESSSRCKILCTSPIFRVASTSTDSSVFRGASLSTMPLEMGVYVASRVATTAAERYTAPVRMPVDRVLGKVRPGLATETIGGYVRDGLNERAAERDAQQDREYFPSHKAHVSRSLQTDPTTLIAIGPDSGPERPFPLQFQGKVVRGTGRSQAELGIPTANLSGVPDEIRYRLLGVYFGWACILPKNRAATTAGADTADSPKWYEAIITVGPCRYAPLSANPKPIVAVHLLNYSRPVGANTPPKNNTKGSTLLGETLKILTLGLLHPPLPSSPSQPPQTPSTSSSPISPQPPPATEPPTSPLLITHSRNISLTLLSLSRPHWHPESVVILSALEAQMTASTSTATRGLLGSESSRGFTMAGVVKKGVVNGMGGVAHRVGVRVKGVGEERDRIRGEGGHWVRW